MLKSIVDTTERIPAVIIARGGSVRLPRKNVLSFCGRPLVAWSIIQCHMSEYVTDTVLATDDDEIMEIGEEYGAHIVKRPVMHPDITANVVYTMVMKELFDRGWDCKIFVHILPTSATRQPNDIDDMIYLFKMGDGTPVSPCVSRKETLLYKKTDVLNTIEFVLFDNEGSFYESALGMCCHDAKKYVDFHVKGRRFAFETDRGDDPWVYSRNYGFRYIPLFVEPWQFYDIDDQDEFELCEWYFKKKGLYKIYNDWWKDNADRIR